MPTYRVYCNECDDEFTVDMYSKWRKNPQYCCACGSEIIYGDLVCEDSEEDDVLSDDLSDIEDWKVDE